MCVRGRSSLVVRRNSLLDLMHNLRRLIDTLRLEIIPLRLIGPIDHQLIFKSASPSNLIRLTL